MKQNNIVKIKGTENLGLILIESKPYKVAKFDYTYERLNLVMREDGSYAALSDDDLELLEEN